MLEKVYSHGQLAEAIANMVVMKALQSCCLIKKLIALLSGGIVGTHAGDLIGEVCLAIEMGADAVDIGKTIHPHPTLGESVGMAAGKWLMALVLIYRQQEIVSC